MPELPEVETIRRGLATEITGLTIRDVRLFYTGAVKESAASFSKKIEGRTVTGLERRGKLLMVRLGDDMLLAVHLKMSGRLWVPPPGTAPDKHTHVVMGLSNGRELHFRDVRKFGWCRAMTPAELHKLPFFRTLGPEPLEIDGREFAALLSGRKARVKGLLLNQQVIAGIGNIYADESLFAAKIHPEAKASDLSEKRLERLHASLVKVLTQAIAENGSSISDYRNAHGDAGAFQNSFKAYGKAGEPCPRCREALVSARVAGRTSTFCPCCQKS